MLVSPASDGGGVPEGRGRRGSKWQRRLWRSVARRRVLLPAHCLRVSFQVPRVHPWALVAHGNAAQNAGGFLRVASAFRSCCDESQWACVMVRAVMKSMPADNCTAGDYWIQLFLGRAEDADVKSEAQFVRVTNS